MAITIYIITNKTNNKSYIGQTNDFKRRMREHKNQASKLNDYLHQSIQKHGWENFDKMILCKVEDCLADVTEKAYIKYFKTLSPNGYNLTEGGQNNRGAITEEARAKMSKARKGIQYSEATKAKMSESQKGKTLSPEHRAKLSESQKGRTRSAETRTKISKANKGRPSNRKGIPHTDETRTKISESHKGKTHSPETRAKLSEMNKGKTLSAETRAKMSESRKGRVVSAETRAKISKAITSDRAKEIFGEEMKELKLLQ